MQSFSYGSIALSRDKRERHFEWNGNEQQIWYILIELRMINIFQIIARGVSLVGSVFGAIRNRIHRVVLLLVRNGEKGG